MRKSGTTDQPTRLSSGSDIESIVRVDVERAYTSCDLMSSSAIARIVATLGGPDIDPSDIEWAAHLPAGQKLIQWLVDQCVVAETVDTAALHAIALEREEAQMYDAPSRLFSFVNL